MTVRSAEIIGQFSKTTVGTKIPSVKTGNPQQQQQQQQQQQYLSHLCTGFRYPPDCSLWKVLKIIRSALVSSTTLSANSRTDITSDLYRPNCANNGLRYRAYALVGLKFMWLTRSDYC